MARAPDEAHNPLRTVDAVLADRIRESEDRIRSGGSNQDELMTAPELEQVIGDLRDGRPLAVLNPNHSSRGRSTP